VLSDERTEELTESAVRRIAAVRGEEAIPLSWAGIFVEPKE
jgi:hypothetical protein